MTLWCRAHSAAGLSRARHTGSRSVPDSSSLSSGLAALTQPFKLRLARAPHEQELGDYASNVVLIEPLATMASVEEFLWPRVHRAGRARGDSPRDAGEAGNVRHFHATCGFVLRHLISVCIYVGMMCRREQSLRQSQSHLLHLPLVRQRRRTARLVSSVSV